MAEGVYRDKFKESQDRKWSRAPSKLEWLIRHTALIGGPLIVYGEIVNVTGRNYAHEIGMRFSQALSSVAQFALEKGFHVSPETANSMVPNSADTASVIAAGALLYTAGKLMERWLSTKDFMRRLTRAPSWDPATGDDAR
jgi:hypothetical protein